MPSPSHADLHLRGALGPLVCRVEWLGGSVVVLTVPLSATPVDWALAAEWATHHGRELAHHPHDQGA